MRGAFHPLHPLPFTEALADYLAHRGFHKARADPLPMALALTVIGNEPNGMKLASELLLDRLLTQFWPGFDHQGEALGPPLLDARLHMVRSGGIDEQRS